MDVVGTPTTSETSRGGLAPRHLRSGYYAGNTDVIEVRAQESLEVRRTGTRAYTFSGRSIPARDQNVRDEFVVKTGRDAKNAPGRSNARSLLIF